MLLYIDPGTGGAIFSGLSTLLAAIGGSVAVFFACLSRPIRSLFRVFLAKCLRGRRG